MPLRPTSLLRVPHLCVSILVVFCAFTSAQQVLDQPGMVLPRIVQPVDETQLTVLKGNIHRLARSQFDQGVAPADLPMDRMLLVLKRSPEQESALRKLLDDQQDKASPNYHKWMTPEQFGKQFGPADQDMQIVTAWLQSHGFRIGQVAKGRNIIEFSGTAAQVQDALHTSIHKYLVNGKEHWANASDPQIPTALTPVVAGVHTLHNFLKQPQIHFSEEKIAAKYVPGKQPLVTFSDGQHAPGATDYATIYNINPLYKSGVNGAGTTIAVVARSDLFEGGQDVYNFCNIFAASCGFFLNTIINGPDPGDLGGGEEAEATLDATWSGAIAPGANVDFVVSATTNTTDGVDLSEEYIIDNDLANVMTESFGGCEAALDGNSAQVQAIESLAEQAAAQGITYMVSAGDEGAEGCDNFNTESFATGPISVNVLASTPYTVAVGGTMFNENGQDSKYWSASNGFIAGSALSYIPENVWNESCTASNCTSGVQPNILAGGGGASIFFPKPSWQSGVAGIPGDGARDLPDVSLTAAMHDPYLICLEASCAPNSQNQIYLYFAAGTSASSPSFAGIMALVNQKMNSRQGQGNYVLYKLAAAENLAQCNASNTSTPPASTCIFNDVTTGNNAVPGEVGYGSPSAAYQSGGGYDLASGLGSVNVANLVNNWNTVTFKPSAAALTLNPTTLTHGQSVTVNITVAPQNGTGTPTGNVSLIANNGPPPTQTSVALSSYTLSGGTLLASTTALPGGTYTLSANYAGDGTYAPSDSTPFGPITVNSEASMTALSVFGYPNQNGVFPPFTGGPYGTFAYLRADVSSSASKCPPDCGVATGSVEFMDNGVAIVGQFGNPNYELNSQGNTATPNGFFAFGPGNHSVIASYLGDNSYQASQSSPPYAFAITQAATTTTVTAQGANLTATVTTNSGGNPPSGTVTFFVDGAQAGAPALILTQASAVINPQTDVVTTGASATAGVTVGKPPSQSFKATYNGDTNYITSTSSAVADFTLAASANTVTVAPGASGNLTLTVTVVDGLPAAVQFAASSCAGLPSEAACSFTPASITGSGATTLMITTKAPTAAMMLGPQRLKPENQQNPGRWMATSGLIFAGVVLLGVPLRRRCGSVLLSLIIVACLSLSACGGGGSSSGTPPPDPGTPAGTYPVVLTATSGALQRTVKFTLTVQ